MAHPPGLSAVPANRPPPQGTYSGGGGGIGDWLYNHNPFKLANNLGPDVQFAARYKQAMVLGTASMIATAFGFIVACSFFNFVALLHLLPIFTPCCNYAFQPFYWSIISIGSIVISVVSFVFALIDGGCLAESGIVNLIIVFIELINLWVLSNMDSGLRGKLTQCLAECGCCGREAQLRTMVPQESAFQLQQQQRNAGTGPYAHPELQYQGPASVATSQDNKSVRTKHTTPPPMFQNRMSQRSIRSANGGMSQLHYQYEKPPTQPPVHMTHGYRPTLDAASVASSSARRTANPMAPQRAMQTRSTAPSAPRSFFSGSARRAPENYDQELERFEARNMGFDQDMDLKPEFEGANDDDEADHKSTLSSASGKGSQVFFEPPSPR